MKKSLSFVLLFLLSISLLALPVFAEEDTSSGAIEIERYEEEDISSEPIEIERYEEEEGVSEPIEIERYGEEDTAEVLTTGAEEVSAQQSEESEETGFWAWLRRVWQAILSFFGL